MTVAGVPGVSGVSVVAVVRIPCTPCSRPVEPVPVRGAGPKNGAALPRRPKTAVAAAAGPGPGPRRPMSGRCSGARRSQSHISPSLPRRPKTASAGVSLALRSASASEPPSGGTAVGPARPGSARTARGGSAKRMSKVESAEDPRLEMRRVRMRNWVTALNVDFHYDFDYDRLPRLPNEPNKLKVNFSVPGHLLWKEGMMESDGKRVCYVSPAKIEPAFLLSSVYVGELGANPRGPLALAESRARYLGFLDFLCTEIPVIVATALMDRDGQSLRFIDGKHRFCVYRDLGLSCIPMLVPLSQYREIKRRFGAPKTQRNVVRRVTKVLPKKQAQYDPTHNSWNKASRARASASVASCQRVKSASTRGPSAVGSDADPDESADDSDSDDGDSHDDGQVWSSASSLRQPRQRAFASDPMATSPHWRRGSQSSQTTRSIAAALAPRLSCPTSLASPLENPPPARPSFSQIHFERL